MNQKSIIIKEDVFNFENIILKYFNDPIDVVNITANGKIDFAIVEKQIKSYPYPPNLYGLLIKRADSPVWDLKYVGQRKSKFIKQRLREHLLKKHPKTGSKLDKVLQALQNEYEIGIKLFAIQPNELRTYYESKLLKTLSSLEWNIQK